MPVSQPHVPCERAKPKHVPPLKDLPFLVGYVMPIQAVRTASGGEEPLDEDIAMRKLKRMDHRNQRDKDEKKK